MTPIKENRIRVAIQGGFGAFHEIAAKRFFGEIPIEIVPCETFNDLFNELSDKRVDCGIVAMENSVAGSLLQNLALLRESGLTIMGEQYLRVVQNLIALPGQTINDIKEIHSHPIAIQQCQFFLNELRRKGVRIIDSADTALSVKWIREENLLGIGALGSELAARMYNMEILKTEVETNKRNFTRFQLITESEKVKELEQIANQTINKATLCFSLKHEEGQLSQVLSVLSFYSMNLTKIQSLPIIGVEWEYFFYIDLVFKDYYRYQQALGAIKPLTEHFQLLGEYQHGQRPTENKTIIED
ncbi:MAG: prephenate dehydratase [Bacteroidales bacterium]|nr:prephenate dehydratase [Bacteroidales bacterium]